MSEENLEQLQKRGRGRPPGAKNKPKRGRPKGSKTKTKSKPVAPPKPEPPKKTKPSRSEDDILNSLLNEDNLLDVGYNVHTDKIINQEPIDASFYYRGSKHVPVAGAQYEFTADMIEELRKCKNDIVYFAENFFYIVSIDEGKQKIHLYEAQKRMLLNMVNNRFSVNLASRQSGKSTLLTIFVLWMACFNDDHRAAIVANKESTAINIFKRVRMAYEQLPNYIKPGVKDYGKTGMTLGNDSSIIVSTTTATSIRGDSLSTLAIDEVAFIECLDGDSYVTVKNKKTDEVKKITLKELECLLKQSQKFCVCGAVQWCKTTMPHTK